MAYWDPARGNVLSGSNVVTVADQASGGQDTLTGVAGFEPQWVANDSGYPAWTFGANKRFTVPDSADLSITTQVTFSAWVAPGAAGTNRVIMSRWAAGAYRWNMYIDSANNIDLEIDGGTSVGAQAYGTSSAWAHVAFVYDGTQATNATRLIYYKNGALVGLNYAGTIPATLTDDANQLIVGDQDGLTTPFVGSMGTLGIWGRPLSAAEILSLYNNYQKR